MKTRRFKWLLAAFLLLAVAGSTYAEEANLQTEEDRVLYALGMMIAARMPKFDPTAAEIDMIVAGLKDGLQGREPRVDLADYAEKVGNRLRLLLAR